MTPVKLLSTLVICALPFTLFAYTPTCDGNTYEINKCLKKQVFDINTKIDNIKNQDTESFKEYRKKICTDISSKYSGGTYESVSYGNCVISMSEWYVGYMSSNLHS
jgi:hypothetical protein